MQGQLTEVNEKAHLLNLEIAAKRTAKTLFQDISYDIKKAEELTLCPEFAHLWHGVPFITSKNEPHVNCALIEHGVSSFERVQRIRQGNMFFHRPTNVTDRSVTYGFHHFRQVFAR